MPADDPALRFDVFAEQEQVLDRQGDRTAKAEILRRMAELSDRLGDPDRTFTSLLGQSRQAFETSDYDRAVDLATQAADTARAAGLGARVAEGHLWAGKALTWHGEGAAAQTQLNTALEAARAEGQTALVAEALRYLAMLASNEGRFADALDFGVRAREEFARDGDLEAESTALAQHAVTLFNLGRVAESRDLFEQVLPVFMASGHLYRQSVALGNLASSSTHPRGLRRGGALVRAGDRAVPDPRRRGGNRHQPDDPRADPALDEPLGRGPRELRVRAGGPARRSAPASSPSTRALWLGVGMLEYGRGDRKRRSRTPGAWRRTPPSRRPARRPPPTRCWSWPRPCCPPGRTAGSPRRTRPPARLRRCFGTAGSRRRSLSAPPSASSSRNAGGLDPTRAAAEAAALVAELDRPAIDVSMRSAHLLGQLWELLAGSPGHEAAQQQLREAVRAYVDRRLVGAEDPERQAGFLAVPSVARLVQLLDAP